MKIAQNSQRKWFPDASCGEPEKQFTEDQVGDGNEILVEAVLSASWKWQRIESSYLTLKKCGF